LNHILTKKIPAVTVMMPVFNAEKYLYQSIDSILYQTFEDFELIIIDDGSSDKSAKIIDAFSDGRIKLIKNVKNLGLTASLNKAIKQAKGKYISRMDADDISFPKRLELQFNFLEENPDIDLIASRALVFNNHDYSLIGLLPYKTSHDLITSSPWKSIPMPHPTWMGRAEWFKRYLYKTPEVIRAEDQELLLRSMTNSKFYTLPEVLLAYRQSKFNFRKTLIARVSLLKTQVLNFKQRKQYGFLVASMLFFILKVLIDLFAVLPGFSGLFFSRMGLDVPEEVEVEFGHLIKILSKKTVID
jgi:glycosyltransferase involved in cell wall biosynthesis